MPLFFRKRTFEDPVLGRFTLSRRRWWGTRELPHHGAVAVGISGTKTAPDAEGLALARELPERYEGLRESIAQALFEHYTPWCEEPDAPRIASAAGVWSHVEVEAVRIGPMEWGLTLEIVYTTEWDIEHALGACIHGWRLVELCGSVGP